MPVLPRRSSWNDTLALKGRVQAAMLCNLKLGRISEDGLRLDALKSGVAQALKLPWLDLI